MADKTNDDPRLALVYQEALRGLDLQREAVESLRARAATLVFATSFVSSLFGAQALADGLGVWDWTAVSLLLGIGALTTIMLWPYYGLTFRLDAKDLLTTYIDTDKPATLTEMHRGMALSIKDYWRRNGHIIKRLRTTFQFALILLLLEIFAWMISIATS